MSNYNQDQLIELEVFRQSVIDLIREIMDGMHEGHECEVCEDFLKANGIEQTRED